MNLNTCPRRIISSMYNGYITLTYWMSSDYWFTQTYVHMGIWLHAGALVRCSVCVSPEQCVAIACASRACNATVHASSATQKALYYNNSEENKQVKMKWTSHIYSRLMLIIQRKINKWDKMNSFQLQWTPGKLTGNRNHVFLAWFITVQTVYWASFRTKGLHLLNVKITLRQWNFDSFNFYGLIHQV